MDIVFSSFLLGSMKDLNMKGLINYHWVFNSNLVGNNDGYKHFWVFEGFKYGRIEGLFGGISLESEDTIVSLFLVED